MNKIKLFLISIFFVLIASTSFAALPVVLYTDIIAGPNTGGEDDDGCYLSIFGTGFGTPSEGLPPATTKVYIGGQEVEHYKYLGTCRGRSDIQQLSVLLGSNVVTGAIKVTTSEGDSNTDLSFTVSAGDIYFVDDTGNNGTGVVNDIAHPYLTMAYVYALADFGAGDFIVVRGGTYDISSAGLTLTKSGSSKTACINLMGYPGETPLMSKEASLTQTSCFYTSTDVYFNTISNFRINLQDSSAWAFYFGSNIALERCWNDGRIVNCYIEEGMLGSNANTTSYVNAHQMMLARVDRLKFYGNNVGNANPLSGVQSHIIYLADAYDRMDYGWNVMQNVPYCRGSFQMAGDQHGDNLRSDRVDEGEEGTSWYGYNADVLVHDSLFSSLGGPAITANQGSFGPIYYYNNIFNDVAKSSASQTYGYTAIQFRGHLKTYPGGIYYFYNNTMYSSCWASGGLFCLGNESTTNESPISVTLYNNILYDSSGGSTPYYKTAGGYTGATTSDYNLWYNSSASKLSETHQYTGDPVFTTLGSDFTLQVTSDAIDHGSGALVNSYVLKDYAANSYGATTYEIGAYLYGTGGETFVSISAEDHNPLENAINVAKDSNIVVHVKQGTYTVDSATISMTVEGVDVTGDLAITGTAADYTVTYDPATDFTSGQVVNVTVDASDTDTPANAMPQDVYSFTVEYFGTSNTGASAAYNANASTGSYNANGMSIVTP